MSKKRFEMVVEKAERERWQTAARAEGRSLAAWLRRVANAAACPVEVAESGPEPVPFPGPAATSSPAPKKTPKGNPPLCDRCERLGNGQPLTACGGCMKAWGLMP